MKENPKLSVVLLTYNRAGGPYLKLALESILNQTFDDFELIVMDNHSTDETAQFILSYEDPRLTYIRQPPDGNASTNYLTGLWHARGKYIILTHDDDIMEPNMLATQMAFVEAHPGVLCVGSNVSLIDEHGGLIQEHLYELEADRLFDEAKYIKAYLEEKLWIPTPTLLFDRKAHISALARLVQKKDSRYQSSGDIWLLFLLNLKGQIGIISEPLLRYRQHPGQESRNVDQSAPMANMAGNLLSKRGKNPKLQPYLPDIWGSYLRFKSQNVLFNTMKRGKREHVGERILRLRERWVKAVQPEHRSIDSVLPFEIFMREFGLSGTIEPQHFDRIHGQPAKFGVQRGYREWLEVLYKGGQVFQNNEIQGPIAIFGSMLTAFILVEAARNAGIEVYACFDSAPARIGANVMGVPVIDLENLSEHEQQFESMILSSERDHEAALVKILKSRLVDQNKMILSWKTLVHHAFESAMTADKSHHPDTGRGSLNTAHQTLPTMTEMRT